MQKPADIVQESEKIYKTVSLFYPDGKNVKKENHALLWSSSTALALQLLVAEWLLFMQQENKLYKKIVLQSIALNEKETEAFISFDASLFSKQQSAYDKLLIIEALCQTIKSAIPTIHAIMPLVNNTPLEDMHIDCTKVFPITGYYADQPERTVKKISVVSPTIIINTMAHHTKGRTIDDAFERALLVEAAEELKKELCAALPDSTVIIPRIPTEYDPLFHTLYTNKSDVTLVISLHFYKHNEQLPRSTIYYYLYNNTTDFWQHKKSPLALELYNYAYHISLQESYAWAMNLHNELTNMVGSFIDSSIIGMPYKPLKGIIKPAIALEIGIKNKSEIVKVIKPVAAAFIKLMQA